MYDLKTEGLLLQLLCTYAVHPLKTDIPFLNILQSTTVHCIYSINTFLKMESLYLIMCTVLHKGPSNKILKLVTLKRVKPCHGRFYTDLSQSRVRIPRIKMLKWTARSTLDLKSEDPLGSPAWGKSLRCAASSNSRWSHVDKLASAQHMAGKYC